MSKLVKIACSGILLTSVCIHQLYAILGVDEKINFEKKLQQSQQLTENAVKYFAHQPMEVALRHFTYKPQWYKGDLSIFVLDEEGTFYTAGDEHHLIWTNIGVNKKSGPRHTPLIKEMLNAGQKGQSITYLWNNAYKSSFVKTVQKNGKKFVLGSGFFPTSDEFTTRQLVQTAANYFYTNGPNITFTMISNPTGAFVQGDIYTFVYDMHGVVKAHGQNPGLVGQKLIDLQDSRGKQFVKDMIQLAQQKREGWLDYYWHNTLKRSYVKRVTDPKTKKSYIISAGFYPHINANAMRNYVNRAVKHIQAVGPQRAFSDFTSLSGDFSKGGLGIFVYNYDGVCLANGEHPAFVGQNLIKRTDEDGKPIIKEMIRLAKEKKRGYMNFRENNASTVSYIQSVEMPQGNFIVGAQFHPASKSQITRSFVYRAARYLRNNSTARAFRLFSDPNGPFIRGDLTIFVYSAKGTRLVNGMHKENIWQNYAHETDQEGRAVIADMLDISRNGGGWIEYQTRNATRRVFVKAVRKVLPNGKAEVYIVGSGYFL